MIIQSKIRFANEKTEKAFYRLKEGTKKEKDLFKHMDKALDKIEENVFCGIQIPKRLIPKKYIQKHNITNLWKYNLPGSWRLIYSIVNEEILIISLILEWLKHKDYEKKFNY